MFNAVCVAPPAVALLSLPIALTNVVVDVVVVVAGPRQWTGSGAYSVEQQRYLFMKDLCMARQMEAIAVTWSVNRSVRPAFVTFKRSVSIKTATRWCRKQSMLRAVVALRTLVRPSRQNTIDTEQFTPRSWEKARQFGGLIAVGADSHMLRANSRAIELSLGSGEASLFSARSAPRESDRTSSLIAK